MHLIAWIKSLLYIIMIDALFFKIVECSLTDFPSPAIMSNTILLISLSSNHVP